MIDAERILLINCSAPNYNLAIEKMRVFFGPRATEFSRGNELFFQQSLSACDAVILSVIFSWDVPYAIDKARQALDAKKQVIIGGGGTFKLSSFIHQQLGIRPFYKPHTELEAIDSQFKMVYFTRGCVETCSFCNVWRIEGRNVTLNPVSRPALVLMDNNLSEIPRQYQEHIVEKYLSAGIRSVDCNSGFEPKGITPEMVQLFDQLPMRWWRLGFDEISEEPQVVEAIKIIKAFSKKKIRVYTMFGHEPIETCRYRCEKVIQLGCEPVPQAFIPLDAITKTPSIQHDWNDQLLADFQRFFYSPMLWRTMKLQDYKPRIGVRPFR